MSISPRDGRLKVQSVFFGVFLLFRSRAALTKSSGGLRSPVFFLAALTLQKKKVARCMSVEKKKKNPVRGKKPNRVGAIKRGERRGIILGG